MSRSFHQGFRHAFLASSILVWKSLCIFFMVFIKIINNNLNYVDVSCLTRSHVIQYTSPISFRVIQRSLIRSICFVVLCGIGFICDTFLGCGLRFICSIISQNTSLFLKALSKCSWSNHRLINTGFSSCINCSSFASENSTFSGIIFCTVQYRNHLSKSSLVMGFDITSSQLLSNQSGSSILYQISAARSTILFLITSFFSMFQIIKYK